MELRKYDLLPLKYKQLWSDWEIRAFVLGSLTLQVLLIALSPNRKRRPSRRIRFVIWSCYLLADAVANFALGHLADNQSDSGAQQQSNSGSPQSSANHTSAAAGFERNSLSHRGGGGGGIGGGLGGAGGGGDFNSNVLAFWAPFLLLHLGGPDTITAFSLEDNELWLRHLFGLGFQLAGCGYVLLRSLPHNSLLVPTVVMLAVGSIKYAERTFSLYRGSADGFRDYLLKKPDPGPMYYKFMEEYQSKVDAGLDTRIEIVRENELKFGAVDDDSSTAEEKDLTDVEAMLHAHKFFKIFRCLVADLVLSFQERKDSRQFFLKLSPNSAFKVISMELNFLYDVLYTKALVVHKKVDYALRFTCSAGIAASFLMFFLYSKKRSFHHIDVWITYALLIGAVALDVLGLAMLVLSDWTVVSLRNNTLRSCLAKAVVFVNRKRWSGVISRVDLIGFCLREVPERKIWCLRRFRRCLEEIAGKLCLQEMLEEVTYSHRTKLNPHLMGFIFKELKFKSADAKDLKTTLSLIERKGSHVLTNHRVVFLEGAGEDVLSRSVEVEFDECVLLWHIATDLCRYQYDEDRKNGTVQPPTGGEPPIDYRDLSRQLSEYMLYLLVMQPVLTSSMAGIGLLRYRDTCEEARLVFDLSSEELTWEDACKMLLSVTTDPAKPSDVKGDRSKSVLFDGCVLAKRLMKMEVKPASAEVEVDDQLKPGGGGGGAYSDAAKEFKKEGGELGWEERWEVIAKVWVELLSYAACHCRGIAHARKLSTGGELLNLVWFLMAHLGLGQQFRTETGQARAKLVFEK